jgi:hypothetical protein
LVQARSLDVSSAISFCTGLSGVERAAFSLKQSPCPHCGCIGSLNRHSRALGNDPNVTAGQAFRGKRVFCSNRGQRGGCGRTFAFFLADVLPRHTLTASLLWPWLVKLLAGLSFKAAAEKLRQCLASVRTRLCREQSPPVSSQADPLLQTMEHLRVVFSGSDCPPADFQLHFQRPFLG